MYRLVTLRLVETYFRHRWLFLVPIILTVVSAGVYLTKIMKVSYSSQSVILVSGQTLLSSLNALTDASSNAWITPAQATTDEVNQLIKTDAFIRAIINQTDLEKKMTGNPANVDQVIKDTRKEVWATTIGDKQIQINGSDEKPEVAYQLVNAVTEIYIQWKMNSKMTESQTALDFFTTLIKQYKTEVDQSRANLTAYVIAHPEPVRGNRPFSETSEIDRLNGEIKIAEDRYTNALGKQEDAQLSLQQVQTNIRQTYVIMDAPKIADKPSTSLAKNASYLGMFLGVGLLLSLALIVGSYLLDTTIRFSLDVTTQVNLPVLAMVPDTTPHTAYFFRRLRRSTPAQRHLSKSSGGKAIKLSDNHEDHDENEDGPAIA